MKIQDIICNLLRLPVHTDASRSEKLPDQGSIGFNSDNGRLELNDGVQIRSFRYPEIDIKQGTNVESTTDVTDIITETLQADEIKPGDIFKVKAFFVVYNDTGATESVTITTTLSGTNEGSLTAQIPSTGVPVPVKIDFLVKFKSGGDYLRMNNIDIDEINGKISNQNSTGLVYEFAFDFVVQVNFSAASVFLNTAQTFYEVEKIK